MNILYHFRTRGTGAEGVHIAGIANAFERMGHRVVFCSPTKIDPRLSAGKSPYTDPKGSGWIARLSRFCPSFVFELLEIGYNLPAFFRLRALLRSEPFQLLYERHAYFLVAAAVLASSRGIPMIVEVNELVGDARVRREPVLAWLTRLCDLFVFKRASLIAVVSPHLKQRIVAMGIPERKILVLPNGVSLAEFQTPADGQPVRVKHQLLDSIVIGFVGWFVEWHRLDRLIAVFARCGERHPNLKLMLVGEGELKEPLASAAERLGIRDRVLFTGAVPRKEIPSYIGAMDICVVPHSNEYRSPIKLFEYMGQGKAVLAPRTDAIAMAVNSGINGLLFDSEEELFAALDRLTRDPGLRERLGRQARADVLEHHTWENNAKLLLGALLPEPDPLP